MSTWTPELNYHWKLFSEIMHANIAITSISAKNTLNTCMYVNCNLTGWRRHTTARHLFRSHSSFQLLNLWCGRVTTHEPVSSPFYSGLLLFPPQVFIGNVDGSRVKENYFSPPIMGRYIRLNPVTFQNRATLRLELFGSDLNSRS